MRCVWIATAVAGFALPGCRRPAEQSSTDPGAEVIAYVALDREFSEPILRDFTTKTGIAVRAVYDVESTKTVGLVNRIRAEAGRPRCDVFWNNEIINTLRLKREGLLQPCRPEQAANYPARDRDPDGCWYGFAARARVLIVNTDLVKPAELPASIRDLADPRWKGRGGLAKPLFGTTASHIACLFVVLGDPDARTLLASLKANDVQVLGGNKACAEAVGAGRLAIALTDTDDAIIEQDAGRPVKIVFPDVAPGGMGTLLLPNTLALVKDCPHPQAGARLIEYLLSPDVEARLAAGPSAQIPLHKATTARSRVCDRQELRAMDADFERAAEAWDAAAGHIEREFLAP